MTKAFDTILKMEAVCFSETLLSITQHGGYSPEDKRRHNQALPSSSSLPVFKHNFSRCLDVNKQRPITLVIPVLGFVLCKQTAMKTALLIALTSNKIFWCEIKGNYRHLRCFLLIPDNKCHRYDLIHTQFTHKNVITCRNEVRSYKIKKIIFNRKR